MCLAIGDWLLATVTSCSRAFFPLAAPGEFCFAGDVMVIGDERDLYHCVKRE